MYAQGSGRGISSDGFAAEQVAVPAAALIDIPADSDPGRGRRPRNRRLGRVDGGDGAGPRRPRGRGRRARRHRHGRAHRRCRRRASAACSASSPSAVTGRRLAALGELADAMRRRRRRPGRAHRRGVRPAADARDRRAVGRAGGGGDAALPPGARIVTSAPRPARRRTCRRPAVRGKQLDVLGYSELRDPRAGVRRRLPRARRAGRRRADPHRRRALRPRATSPAAWEATASGRARSSCARSWARPAMIVEVIMPKLGIYEDDVELVEWLVEDGAARRGGRSAVRDGDREGRDRDRGRRRRHPRPAKPSPGSRRRSGPASATSCRPRRARRAAAAAGERRMRRRPTRRAALLEQMMRIRLFEDRVRREFGKGDMPGFVHTYVGAEAVAVGVCAHLGDGDLITSTHRGHGHCLAKGCRSRRWSPSCTAARRGCARAAAGRCTSPTSPAGCSGPTPSSAAGSRSPSGAALAAQTFSATAGWPLRSSATAPSNQGIFHESLNLAAIWRLPVVFVCENNGWAESTPASYAISRRGRRRREQPPTASRASPSTRADYRGRVRQRPARPSHGRGGVTVRR